MQLQQRSSSRHDAGGGGGRGTVTHATVWGRSRINAWARREQQLEKHESAKGLQQRSVRSCEREQEPGPLACERRIIMQRHRLPCSGSGKYYLGIDLHAHSFCIHAEPELSSVVSRSWVVLRAISGCCHACHQL